MHPYSRMAALVPFLTLCTPSFGQGQAKSPEQFGAVDFLNSCTPAAQARFQRGVAMRFSRRPLRMSCTRSHHLVEAPRLESVTHQLRTTCYPSGANVPVAA